MVDISQISTPELERLIEEYPWFNVARREYIVRLLGDRLNEETAREAARRSGIFLLSRSGFVKLLCGKKAAPEHSKEQAPANAPAKKYYVVGGDYFGREDFEDLERQGLAVETPSFGQPSVTLSNGDAAKKQQEAPRQPRKKLHQDDICTETLAGIYFQQEIYPKAIEIYEKLILLYPEKSAYFAALIEKVKNIK